MKKNDLKKLKGSLSRNELKTIRGGVVREDPYDMGCACIKATCYVMYGNGDCHCNDTPEGFCCPTKSL
ncbi:hypothetical protein ODZ84_18755 [Chryseobacterium fluminis]|uniref:hypothetical protein n=1 Tax=Chryseobacterium fluminis TaxID=2983606 RepID=UPI002250FC14|nr:hypothetical protein [Chryseobacterium sp. MMS21-Ot14]UZT97212.1 hypothetical protein ODZ84_18755 [Chryseobacterium sp. MMS21-Ot14]